MIFKNYEIDLVKVASAQTGLERLHALHYAETEVNYKKHQVGVNYPHYIACEAKGSLFLYGAQTVDSKQLVAYLFMYLSPSAHDSSVVATADMFFIEKEHRGSGIARRLLQFASNDLKERGADYMFMTDKSPVGGPHIGLFLETEGFAKTAIAYSKAL